MEIKRIIVFISHGTDQVYLHTDLPTPFTFLEGTGETLCMKFETTKGTGVDYVKKNFGIIPEIIENMP